MLKAKNEMLARFNEWKTLVVKQSEQVMKVLKMDNDKKFVSKSFDNFLRKHDIAWQTSSPYTTQQNRVAERAN